MFVVTEDWSFMLHRLPQARAALDLGYRVVVATRVNADRARIEAEGVIVEPVPFDRAGTHPLRELRVVASLWRAIRRYRPSILHVVAVKPITDAGLAALPFRRLSVLNAFTGLGSVLGTPGARGWLQVLISAIVRFTVRANRAHALVQNLDDRRDVLDRGFAVPARLHVIRGSGVDVRGLQPMPEPPGPVVATMVSRILWDKGVAELVEAARILRARGAPVTVRLVGDRDPANPNSAGADDLQRWRAAGEVELPGYSTDVRQVWTESHIAVLPSYREGMPKSLLEPAACGRPLVTTDTTGCRDLVPDGNTGVLVPLYDAEALADAIQKLAENPEMRRRMGDNARALVEREFSEERVIAETQALYHDLAARAAGRRQG